MNKNLRLNFDKKVVYPPMWDATRTYVTSELDPKEKSSHLIMLNRFNNKEGDK